MHGRVARYDFNGDAHELARKAEAGLLPIFQSQPGFKGYTVIATEGQIISFSAWDSEAEAEAANAVAADWVAGNLGGELDLKDGQVGEILLSSTLGVKAGATA